MKSPKPATDPEEEGGGVGTSIKEEVEEEGRIN